MFVCMFCYFLFTHCFMSHYVSLWLIWLHCFLFVFLTASSVLPPFPVSFTLHVFFPASDLSITCNSHLTVPPNTLKQTDWYIYRCICDWWTALWKASHVPALLFLTSFTVAPWAWDVASIFPPPSAHNTHQGRERERWREIWRGVTLLPYSHHTSHSSLFLPSSPSICPWGPAQREVK